MKKQVKKIFLISLEIIILLLLTKLTLKFFNFELNSTISISEFINFGLRDIYVIFDSGEKGLDFMKLLTIISVYVFIELNLITYTAYLSEGFKEIVRYHSKNKFDYVIKILKISQKWIIKSILYWCFTILIAILIFKKVNIINLNDIITLIIFLILNYISNSFIILISKDSVTTVISYISKIYIFIAFLNKEIYIFLVILLFGIVYFNINRKIGEKLWKLQ